MFKNISRGVNFLLGNSLKKEHIFIGTSLDYLHRERDIDKNSLDYIRLATLELVSNEIKQKQIPGSVAELGVYKGKFARHINLYFADREFYLFDTFEGFDKRDVATEKENNYSTGEQNFSDTSVEKVLSRMPHPNMCKPVKGFFPESANGINAQFAFVSLDADLFDPIYQGLHFFYPKLSAGGYIFIHDFNNDSYRGARQAVERFAGETQVSFVPIPDTCGTAVITK
jgi:O-methyltransferase